MADRWFPKNPRLIHLRPLNQGIRRDLPPQLIPTGGAWTLENLWSDLRGLKRRAAYEQYMGNNAITFTSHVPIVGIAPLWKTDGTQKALLISSKFVYEMNAYSAPASQTWTYSTGTITCPQNSTGVVGSSTVWATNSILSGDYILMSVGGAGEERIEISSITDDTNIVLKSAAANAHAAGSSYRIERAIKVDEEYLVDYTVIAGTTNKVVIADRARPPYSWDGSTFENFAAQLLSNGSAGTRILPACVHYFGGSGSDRLWVANTIEGTGWPPTTEYPQRIRWSAAEAPTTFASLDWIDLPYAATGIKRLTNIGHLLLVFLEDTIFYGRPSNNPDLPYIFYNLNTKGIGLSSPRSLVAHLGGVFFVGRDNIYFLDSDLKLNPIGDPVVKSAINDCSNLYRVYGTLDANNDRICFGFPESGDDIAKVWNYHYKTKSWSFDSVTGQMLDNPQLDLALAWTDLTSGGVLGSGNEAWTGISNAFSSWEQIESGDLTRKVYIGKPDGKVNALGSGGSQDAGSTNIPITYESPDIDLDLPGTDKTLLAVSVLLEDYPASALSFTLSTSTDGGNSWTNQGSISIGTSNREGRRTLQETGSKIRLRLTSTTDVEVYTISEIQLKMVERGEEAQFD